jgi:hypothetical protein
MGVTTRATQFQLSMMPIQKKVQLNSGGSHIFRQDGNPYDFAYWDDLAPV